jgi:3-dehydroquinate dehydratase
MIQVDMVKVVVMAHSLDDALMLMQVARSVDMPERTTRDR